MDWEQTTREIATYCAANIFEYEERRSLALAKMDRFRNPLQYAEPSLYTEMLDAIEDYCEDYELNSEDIDIEDILFA